MPKSATAGLLPERVQFTTVEGNEFVRMREAAKLAGIHPAILDMGRQLLEKVGTTTGGVFTLETPEMQKKGAEIQKLFTTGLKRIAKAFKPNVKLKVKAHREGRRLVFWYAA